MTRYAAARDAAQGWIARHEMREQPSQSFWFSEPGKGSIYAYSLTWSRGTLALSGDLGEIVLTHYHAMPTLEEAVTWAATADEDYLLGKSNRRKSIDRERTIASLIEQSIENLSVRVALERDHIPIGNAWGAGLKALLKREVPLVFRGLTDEQIPGFIYELGVFDDWYGDYGWTSRDIHKITALKHGCALIQQAVAPSKVAA